MVFSSYLFQKIPETNGYRQSTEQWFNFITKVCTEKEEVNHLIQLTIVSYNAL